MVSTSARKRSTFLRRLIGAVALRAKTYEEIEADQRANGQAVVVVVLSSVAAGLGAHGFGAGDVGDVAFFSAVALMAWVAWAFVVYEIGTRILPGWNILSGPFKDPDRARPLQLQEPDAADAGIEHGLLEAVDFRGNRKRSRGSVLPKLTLKLPARLPPAPPSPARLTEW
jgi:hypothetical protein